MDQAETLRRLKKGDLPSEGVAPVGDREEAPLPWRSGSVTSSPGEKPAVRVLAITSGKGGVGKTNIVANLAVAFSTIGKKVLVLDADLALGNIDVLFGMVPKWTLANLLSGEMRLTEVMLKGPRGIFILPAGSGIEGLSQISNEQKLTLLSALDRLEETFDLFLIDTAAGISSNVLYFNTAAQEIIVVASSEPTSLTDAYAIIKVLSKRHHEKHFRLLVNMVQNAEEAKEVFRKLTLVTDRYLSVSMDYMGFVPYDDYLKIAVSQQRAVVDLYPEAKSSQSFMRMAHQILAWPMETSLKGGAQFFWRNLLTREPARETSG